MAPDPRNVPVNQEIPSEMIDELTGDEIVISGIAGLYPNCDSTSELMDNLYNQVDMVTETNFDPYKHPNLPKHVGKVRNLNKFDAQFFRVTHWQAKTMDPLSRKIMECAFNAIYDSGINPLTLSRTRLGVFVGSSYSDTVMYNMYKLLKNNMFIITGLSKTMQANRVSYWVDSNAPSVCIDQGCSSSTTCLEFAYNSIKRGDCEAALVGGCSCCVHPGLFMNLKNAKHVCLDGKTKCFDKNGDGYVRSEAVSLIFLQKAKDAKRIYAEIYDVKGKYFAKPDDEFLSIRKSEDIEKFLEEFYSDVKISPSLIEYVEAFGIGIAEADANELDAIGKHFAKSKPIKVGSIKSNMGHTEAASGVCALTKLCLAYQKGELPGNLHYDEPLDQVSAVHNGKIKVLTKNTAFKRGFTALNSFSYTGNNYHILLKGHYKIKDKIRYKLNVPRLILLSGRNEYGLNKVMNKLEKLPIDYEQIALLHNIYKYNISAHTGRSYLVLDTNEKNETVSLAKGFEIYSGASRPVWFLYSGMGSQWCGMGKELMRIPLFAASIQRCQEFLRPFDVDVIKIITDADETMFDDILNCMVGITAIQIALTDVLNALGIYPDNIIGHSLGEIGCAYADGCFTAEEAMLSTYCRGILSLKTPFGRGLMAAVGLGYKDILPLCPPGIDVACHNSERSSTLSGPEDIMKSFISDLVSRGIFAKEVATSNIAYHSRYMTIAGPKLLSEMKSFLPKPKLRSEKWICTSSLREDWDKDSAKYASAEYFTNNLLNPVYFEENATLIPKDAVIIEIAPHSLLQAIMKTSHKECINIPLTKRGYKDPVIYFLEAVGKLYQNGLNPQVDVLYPKVEFPVSTETPLLSHLIEWDHDIDWPVVEHVNKSIKPTSIRNFVMSIHDDEFKFMKGNIKNGVNVFPEAALLVLVWETLGMHRGISYKDMSVIFNDVIFHNQIEILAEDVLKLRVTIENVTNRFEVINNNTQIVTGFIRHVKKAIAFEDKIDMTSQDMNLKGNLFYALLNMNGYSYRDDFQSIHSLNIETNAAYIKWTGEWTTFLDSLIQLSAFSKEHDGVSTPKIINTLSIDVHEQKQFVLDHVPCYKAEIFRSNAVIRCGGVEVNSVIFEDKAKLQQMPDSLLAKEFVPHIGKNDVTLQTALSVNLKIVAENTNSDQINIIELVNSSAESISNALKEIADRNPSHKYNINVVDVTNSCIISDHKDFNKALVIVHDLFSSKKIINKALEQGAFVLTLDQNELIHGNESNHEVVTTMRVGNKILMLLKGRDDDHKENIIYFPIDFDKQLSWLPRLQTELHKLKRVVLVSEKQPSSEFLGLINDLRLEMKNKISIIVVEDKTMTINPGDEKMRNQLRKNLCINILKKGQWGSYVYLEKPKAATPSCAILTSTSYRDLDSFLWMEKPETSKSKIKISYAGLSARDCQKAVGNVKHEGLLFGMDYSGFNTNGEKVMGVVSSGALASTIEADSTLIWPVPQHWNMEEAATVPLPYIHAYYCLFIKGEIKRNQTVFVTGGAGALGQAVISICLSLDCTVFTTVSDVQKKKFLLRLFPKLKEENISNSRYETFFMKVKEVTKNERCNLVINCSSGDLREAAMKCVAFRCRFLDLNDVDIFENKNFGMFYLEEDREYMVVNISTIFRPENYRDRKILQFLVADGIASGVVRPLTRVVYSPLDVSRAFKLVSSFRHRGRALIKMNDYKSLCSNVTALARLSFSNGSHIVICDESNVGVELVDHLIKNDAKHITVHVKPNNDMNYLYAKSRYWHKFNVTIELNSENLGTEEGCERLLQAAQKEAPVTGIYLVQDYEEGQRIDRNEQNLVVANMDIVTRNGCNQLEHFVVISLCSQNETSEYVTTSCEKICELRRDVGLPGLVLKTFVPNKILKNSDLLSNIESPVVDKLFKAMDISLKLKYNNIVVLNNGNKTCTRKNTNQQRFLGLQNGYNDNDLTVEDTKLNSKYFPTESLGGINTNCSNLQSCNKTLETFKHSDNGLLAFYNEIEHNECESFDTWVPMQTQIPNTESAEFMNGYENHLIMIPGFEGHQGIFKSVAERLKILAATLQMSPDLISTSIPDMARILLEQIKSNVVVHNKFYILGYSFGVNVALEIAKLLEAEGRIGTVYCLDSSPDALKIQIDAYLGNLTEAQLQNNILEHMYHLMTQRRNLELKTDLEKADKWSDKVEICMNRLRGQVQYSREYQRNLLQSAYNRIKLTKDYEPELKLASKLVLMRGIPHLQAESLSEDHNLSKYTKQPVEVFHLKSDHLTAPYDPRVSNIVNKMLDQSVLEEFSKKNLCEVYSIGD